MKKFCLISTFAVIFLLGVNEIQSQTTETQPNQVCFKNTDQFTIASKYISGENYVIQVGWPIGYSPETRIIDNHFIINPNIS